MLIGTQDKENQFLKNQCTDLLVYTKNMVKVINF